MNRTLKINRLEKSQKLETLFRNKEKIRIKMEELLSKNGLSIEDFEKLPDIDKTEWFRLKHILEELCLETDEIINE